jgi:hypothetical protein
LLFAIANKIPLGRDWALAPLTFTLALLTLQRLRLPYAATVRPTFTLVLLALQPVLPVSGMDMYSDFRIAINNILKYAAKLEGIFRTFIL